MHLEATILKAGLSLTVAAVDGDDLQDKFDSLQDSGDVEKFVIEGEFEELPQRPRLSCNAYLGAFPIAIALADGADIVVTGPLAHFLWDFFDSIYSCPLVLTSLCPALG